MRGQNNKIGGGAGLHVSIASAQEALSGQNGCAMQGPGLGKGAPPCTAGVAEGALLNRTLPPAAALRDAAMRALLHLLWTDPNS